MTYDEFLTKRDSFVWGSFGRYGGEAVTHTALPNISDSHLLHIIGHVINNRSSYNDDISSMFLHEAAHRSRCAIYVEEKGTVHKLRVRK